MTNLVNQFRQGLKQMDALMGTAGTLIRKSSAGPARTTFQSDESVPIPIELARHESEQAVRNRSENIRAGAGSPRLNTNANVVFELRETWRVRAGQTWTNPSTGEVEEIVPDGNDKLRVGDREMEILNIKTSGSTGAPTSFILECAG